MSDIIEIMKRAVLAEISAGCDINEREADKAMSAALRAALDAGFVMVAKYDLGNAITHLNEFARMQERSDHGGGMMYSMAIGTVVQKLESALAAAPDSLKD